jgi:hypothetical protein
MEEPTQNQRRRFGFARTSSVRGGIRGGRGYTSGVKSTLIVAALIAVAVPRAIAQPAATGSGQADKITVALEVRSEGRGTRDEMATRLMDEVRKGLEASGDIEVNPRVPVRPNRIVWIVSGTAGPPYAASMMVTERYDRETLMVLGVEEDDIAERMMALQIVNDHQIFTDADPAALARRIVVSLNEGILGRLRAVKKKP